MGVLVAGLVALALLVAVSRVGGGGSLSLLRHQALDVLDTLVPSAYPSATFARIVGAGFDPMTSAGTTCGALPCAVGRALGDPAGITKCGVPGVETEGRARRAWIAWKPGLRPKPGDVYLTAYPDSDDIAHTGFAYAWEDDILVTADAGQGPKTSPRADFVRRRYDAQKGTLTRLDNGQVRRVVGWIDLDRAMAHFPRARSYFDPRTADRVYAWPCDPGECQ